jgi:Na+/glutamate symporter
MSGIHDCLILLTYIYTYTWIINLEQRSMQSITDVFLEIYFEVSLSAPRFVYDLCIFPILYMIYVFSLFCIYASFFITFESFLVEFWERVSLLRRLKKKKKYAHVFRLC